MRGKIAEYYGFDKMARKGACEGESCSFYYQCAGATVEERHAEAKRQCGNDCTPPIEKGEKTEASNDFINEIHWFRQQRESGYPVDDGAITYLQFRALLILDEEIRQAEHRLKVLSYKVQERNAEYLQAMFK